MRVCVHVIVGCGMCCKHSLSRRSIAEKIGEVLSVLDTNRTQESILASSDGKIVMADRCLNMSMHAGKKNSETHYSQLLHMDANFSIVILACIKP